MPELTDIIITGVINAIYNNFNGSAQVTNTPALIKERLRRKLKFHKEQITKRSIEVDIHKSQ